MGNAAAISGTFADFKLVKTRSSAQIIVEIPIEQADAALTALGGVPQSGSERPVAVARLTQAPEPGNNAAASKQKQSRDFLELPNSQQAALLCGKPGFQRFLSGYLGTHIDSEASAASAVRSYCVVSSRADLDHRRRAARFWRALRDSYLLEAA